MFGTGSVGFTQSTDRGYSAGVWGDCPVTVEDIRKDPTLGWCYDFDGIAMRTSSNINAGEAFWTGGLKAFGSNGGAIAALDERGGGVTLSSDGDDEGASFGQMIFPFQISQSTGDLWAEFRLKTSTIADTKHGFFAGLIQNATLSATVPITAAGALADVNLVGFHRLEGDGDYLNTVYKADGVTAVTVQEDAVALTADTFVKVGMKFRRGDNRLRFYANGTELTTSKAIPSAAGTDFPNDVRLGFVFAVLNATGTTPGSTSLQLARVIQIPVANVV